MTCYCDSSVILQGTSSALISCFVIAFKRWAWHVVFLIEAKLLEALCPKGHSKVPQPPPAPTLGNIQQQKPLIREGSRFPTSVVLWWIPKERELAMFRSGLERMTWNLAFLLNQLLICHFVLVNVCFPKRLEVSILNFTPLGGDFNFCDITNFV